MSGISNKQAEAHAEHLQGLQERLIQLNGNNLVHKKLEPGGRSGNVINLINEVPNVTLDKLLKGKKLRLDPLQSHEDFLADEDTDVFTAALTKRLEEEGRLIEELVETDLRELKDAVREALGMDPLEGVIPREFYHLDTVSESPKKGAQYNRIQTDIPEASLARHCKKIQKLVLDYQREKGIDTCYLTVGYLRWTRERKGGEMRSYNSPVFLVPCVITEKKKRFYLEYSGQDFGTNPILTHVFRQELGVDFPQYQKESEDVLGIHEYLAQVDALLKRLDQQAWGFAHRMVVGQFKSNGIPISELAPSDYSIRQLDRCYEAIGTASSQLRPLPIHQIDSDEVAKLVPCTAIAADASQYSTVYDVAMERNLVIEGPPGTGKSQTIVNILANAIHHGRKVLFLAQKTVALNVVYERMEAAGLGGKCLLLHSEYSRTSMLFERVGELVKNSDQGEQVMATAKQFKRTLTEFNKERQLLNAYSAFLQHQVGSSGLSVQEVITRYTSLKEVARPGEGLPNANELSSNAIEFCLECSKRVQELVDLIGPEFIEVSVLDERKIGFDPFEMDRLKSKLPSAIEALQKYQEKHGFENVSEHAAELSSKREQLAILLKLTQVNSQLDATCIRSALPSRDELVRLKQTLDRANFLARFCSLRVYQTKKRIYGFLVENSSRDYASLVDVLERLIGLLDKLQVLEQGLSQHGRPVPGIDVIENEVTMLEASWQNIRSELEFIPTLMSVPFEDRRFDELTSQLEILEAQPERMNQKIEINRILSKQQFVDYLPSIRCYLNQCIEMGISFPKALEVSIYEGLARGLSKEFPEYQNFRGDYLEGLRTRLARTVERLDARYCEMLAAMAPEPAPEGNDAVRVKDKLGQTLINHIIQTPAARLTVREFMERAGRELNAYAPCFFMTPSSVAEFLGKDFEFDLLIIDEASQMLAEEAAGSVLRSKQVVVVGDSQQMPPTAHMVSKLDQHPDELDSKNESILERASTCFEDQRMLLYHYRSRHDSLIQYSNARFYGNELRVIPSPREKSEALGLRCIEVEGTYYGKKQGLESAQPNPIEAQRVVDDVCAFMRKPENRDRSLGVAALNKRQSDHIEALLDEKFEMNPSLQKYVDRWKDSPEYFFVKNLERVQGDERDVILISTVFGPTELGKVAQNFGPINQPQGEKRINVLITRAKEQLDIYTSLKPGEITNQSLGAQTWKGYLEFAKSGRLDSVAKRHGQTIERSALERWFCDRLERAGYNVTPKVGISDWRVDLGIRAEDGATDYLCGIQFDGPNYYRSSYARERDHLRDQVLKSQGWNIIHVWSIDFFFDAERTFESVRKKIESMSVHDSRESLKN